MATNKTLVHIPTYCLQNLPGRYLLLSIQAICPEYFSTMILSWWQCLWITMVYGIFYTLDSDSFTVIAAPPIPSQKGKIQSHYELGVAFSRTLWVTFVLNTNFWAKL